MVSLNGYKSDLADVKRGVPQASIPGPFLFIIYRNDLHLVIKYSEIHHFAGDASILNFNSSVKSINKQFDYDLKNFLKASKIFINVGKTEIALFTSPNKQLDNDLKIKLNGKSIYKTDSVKCLGSHIDKTDTHLFSQTGHMIKLCCKCLCVRCI